MYSEMWIICILFLTFCSFCYCQDLPLVDLSHGSIIGLRVKSEVASLDYFSFRGIRYAVPPIGDLRFKAPKPANWTGILDARHDGNACLQPVDLPLPPFDIPKSEDCLFLNVYTPYLSVPKGKTLLPVMVYIHGGAFEIGSSDSRIYGPDFFMREEVVLVTINYRLGVFGFLNLELPGVQGNAGLKDQILALKWIQKEIKIFGGNPDSITIFGNSAGGMSVHCLYLSPLSQGLFHRAISQSGHYTQTIRQSNYEFAVKLASGLNCNATDVETVMTCLKTADAKEIISTQENISGKYHKLHFEPTIDKNLGEDVVLPESLKELNRRKYCNAPYMLGVTKDEGITFLEGRNYTEQIGNLEKFLPIALQQSTQQIKSKAIEKMKKFYFDNKPLSNDTVRGAINLYSDIFLYYTIQTVRTLRSRANVYLYQFTFDGKIKRTNPIPFLKELNITGASHTDELGFLFYSEHLKQNISMTTDDSLTILRMVRLWTNFAKIGDPTPDSSDKILDTVVWKPVLQTNTRHLEIGKKLLMINSDLEPERIAFLDTLYLQSETSKSSVLHCNLPVVFFILIVIILQLLL